MSNPRIMLLPLGAALSCLAAPAAAIEPLVDNLSEPLRANTLIFESGTDGLWAAQTFTADGRRYRLESIDAILGTAVGPPDVVAELRDGDSPTGALLTAMLVPALPAGANEAVTLTPATGVIIEAGQSLTLILGVSNIAEYEWGYADSNIWAGPGVIDNYHYSTDAGQTWANFGSEFPYFIRVNVTLICDPDCNADGMLNLADFGCFQTKFATGHRYADCNGDGLLNLADFGCFQTRFAIGCP